MKYRSNYRPDIDGLRAIAIMAVFIFHIDPKFLSGGFIGVDIFFVISGFLITNMVYARLQAGTFSFLEFYQRRVARLVPTMVLVVATSLILAAQIYSAQDYASAGINAAFGLASLINFKLWRQGSYFEISPDAQPFLHLWSLSVEEQYYIVFPILFPILFRIFFDRIKIVFALITGLSFIFCVILVQRDPVAAFYFLPTRAWELGIGGMVALSAPSVSLVANKPIGQHLGWIGLASVIAGSVLIDGAMTFPSWITLVPVVGAALVICASFRAEYIGRSLLASGVLNGLGRYSYSLYLWHWPIFSFVDYALWHETWFLRLMLKILFCAVFTVTTSRFLEFPLRRFLNQRSRRGAAFALLFSSILACGVTGIQIRNSNYIDVSPEEVGEGGKQFVGASGGKTVLLIGDSNASMYGLSLRRACLEVGCQLIVASSAAGDALAPLDGQPSLLWANSVALARRIEPDVIVFVNAWAAKVGGDPTRLDTSLNQLIPTTENIILITQPPQLPAHVDITSSVLPLMEEMATWELRMRANALVWERASSEIVVIDGSRPFELGGRSIRYADNLHRAFFQDGAHLNDRGADRVIEEHLELLR